MADVVGDRAAVLGHEDVRRVHGQALPQPRQPCGPQPGRVPARRGAGAQQQRRRADRARRHDHDPRGDAVVARRPLGRSALRPRRLLVHAHDDRPVLHAQRLRARNDLDAVTLRLRELHAVRALLGRVRTAEVAEARVAAALHVHRELLRAVARSFAALDEQPVVLVDLPRVQVMDVVLLHVLPGPPGEILGIDAGNAPVPDHPLGGNQRGAGVHQGGAPVAAGEGQGHGAVAGQEPPFVGVERAGHLKLPAGEVAIPEPGTALQDQHPFPPGHQRSERQRGGTAPGARSDDRDIAAHQVHRRACQPAGEAR